MLCAVIGDAAGNFSALDVVLAAIEEAGVLTVFCTGNIAAGGEKPDACVTRIRDAGVYCVQGALDRHLVRFVRRRAQLEKRLSPEDFARVAQTNEHIGGAALEWLGTLPKTRRIEVDGVSMLLAFAGPDGSAKPLTGETPRHVFERHREDAAAALVVVGGDAPAFHRRVADCLFVHPAPVADAAGRARYTLIDTDATPWRVEERGVAL